MSIIEGTDTLIKKAEQPTNAENVGIFDKLLSDLEYPFVSDDLTFYIELINQVDSSVADSEHYIIQGNLHLPFELIHSLLAEVGMTWNEIDQDQQYYFLRDLVLSLTGPGLMTMRSSLTQKFAITSQNTYAEFGSATRGCITKAEGRYIVEEKECLVVPLEIYSQGLFKPRIPRESEADVADQPNLIRLSRLAIYPAHAALNLDNGSDDLQNYADCFPGAFVRERGQEKEEEEEGNQRKSNEGEVIVPVSVIDDINARNLLNEELPSSPFGVNGPGANGEGRKLLDEAMRITREFVGFGTTNKPGSQLNLLPEEGGYVLGSSKLEKSTPANLYGVVNMMRYETIIVPGKKPRIIVIVPHYQSQILDPNSGLDFDTIRWELKLTKEFIKRALELQANDPNLKDAEIVLGVSLGVYRASPSLAEV